METIILALIGLGAVGFVFRKLWMTFQGKSSCGCGSSSCSGESANKGCSCCPQK